MEREPAVEDPAEPIDVIPIEEDHDEAPEEEPTDDPGETEEDSPNRKPGTY